MEIVKAFNENQLHTTITIKGTLEEPLFRASDIGEILGITNIRSTVKDFDDSEKAVVSTDTHGGIQSVTFITEKGLYNILCKSKKPIAKIFQNWVFEVVKEIRLKGKYDLEQKILEKEEKENQMQLQIEEKEEENKKLLKETEKLKMEEQTHSIYIFNTDTRIVPPELKIGYTLNVYKRIKPYKQTHTHHKLEFTVDVYAKNIATVEHYIHLLLSRYKVAGENFCLDVEEAKTIIMNVVNLLNAVEISDPSERQLKLKKMYDQCNVALDIEKPKISTNTIGTQTDFDETETSLFNSNTSTSNNNNAMVDKFDDYVKEMCIVRSDVEVSSVDIIGQYRIWSKTANKEIFHGLKAYLNTRFTPARLQKQDKNQVILGYKGIKLKELEYKKNAFKKTNEETFIFHSSSFSPDGKILISVLNDEYVKWKKSVEISITGNEENELKSYFKDCPYVLGATIWTRHGNGQGYYGLSLKSDANYHKVTSTTGKKVEKREIKTDALIQSWETIAKAAASELVCPAKMSRMIKNKVIIDDDYYYSACKK